MKQEHHSLKVIHKILLFSSVSILFGCSINADIAGLTPTQSTTTPESSVVPSDPAGPADPEVVPISRLVPSQIYVVGDTLDNLLSDVFQDKTISVGETIVNVTVVTPPSYGVLEINDLVPKYTPNVGFVGKDTFSYQATGSSGSTEIRTITIEVRRPHTWSGAGENKLWSNAANWIGGIPTGADIAYFEDACTQCEAQLDGPQSIKGLIASAQFIGKVSFDNQTALLAQLSVGADGIQWTAGTLNLGKGKLISSGPVNYAGGAINGQSGLAVYHRNFTLDPSVSFASETSTFEFTGGGTGGTLTFPASARFNNVYFSHDSSSKTISGNLIVDGLLSFNVSFVSVNGGTIEAYGDITTTSLNSSSHTSIVRILGDRNQLYTGALNGRLPNLEIAKTGGTLTVSGTLSVSKNFTYTSGIVDFNSATYGASKVVFTTSAAGTLNMGSGALNFQNVDFTHDSSSKTLIGTMNIFGTLIFNVTFVTVSGGIINAFGDITATKMTSSGNTMILRIVGSNDQVISGTTNGVIPNMEIAKTGGTATFTGGIGIAKNFTYTSGNTDFNNITLGQATTRFTGANTAGTITSLGVVFGNVTFDHDSTSKTMGSNMAVAGSLTVNTTFVWMGGYQIAVAGNLTITKTGTGASNIGQTEIVLSGNGNQAVSHNTAYKFPGKKFTISKSGGSVSLTTAVSLASSQNLDITSTGSVDMNNFNFDGNGVLNCFSGTVNRGTGLFWTTGTTNTNACTVN